MADKTLVGKDGRTYTVPDDATQSELDAAIDRQRTADASPPNKESSASTRPPSPADYGMQEAFKAIAGPLAPLAPLVTARRVTSALPTVGGIAGSAYGGPAGAALGGAVGEAARQGANAVMGEPRDGTAADIPSQGVLQGVGALIPIGLKAVAGPAKTAARDAWQLAAGATKPGAEQSADQILSMGRGTLLPHNTAALTNAAKANQIPWRTVYAHSEGVPSVPSTLTSLVTGPSSVGLSGLAQGIYSAAGQAGPIGQLIRAAILSQLATPKSPPQ